MVRVPVESRCLVSVGHEDDILEVEFPSGTVYQYLGVTAQTHQELMEAPSLGTYFNAHIKDLHPLRQMKVKRVA